MWPLNIYDSFDRLVYLYLYTAVNNRLDEIREGAKYTETTPLQSTLFPK